jgi:hypothetical protein
LEILFGQNYLGSTAASSQQFAIGNKGIDDVENGFLRQVS